MSSEDLVLVALSRYDVHLPLDESDELSASLNKSSCAGGAASWGWATSVPSTGVHAAGPAAASSSPLSFDSSSAAASATIAAIPLSLLFVLTWFQFWTESFLNESMTTLGIGCGAERALVASGFQRRLRFISALKLRSVFGTGFVAAPG